MCGVIGIISKNIIEKSIINTLLIKSKIRGQHATGITYLDKDMLKSQVIPKNATHINSSNVNTKIIIGHTRYSTSSLEYNQPIFNNDVSIVHNGVITQDDSNNWDNRTYKFKTKNDSEFVLKSYINNEHPIKAYPNASIASIIYDNKNKLLHFFRNEKRPLYYTKFTESIIIASTQDILK
jgi:asparagine synthetase B (glutamine-hydrolysing)